MKPERRPFDLIIASATPRELPITGERACGPVPELYTAEASGVKILLLVTGPGPVNAALALGGALAIADAPLILSTGIGGAYPKRGLAPGGVAVASEEIDADTGVEPQAAGSPPSPLMVPVSCGDFGRYPCDPNVARALYEAALEVGGAAFGPFLTSATVTSTAARAALLEKMYGALCENMEGAAIARGAQLNKSGFGAIRGISNTVGPRSVKSWKIDSALEANGAALALFLEKFARGTGT